MRYELDLYISEDILHSHRLENLKSYIALTDWLFSGDVVFPMRYELGFYISEDDILRSHRRDNFKSYIIIYIFCL
jgi:hypothetical protein